MKSKNKLVYLVISLIMVILGICAVAHPEGSAELVCSAVGIALIIGAVLILRYLSAQQKSLGLQLLSAIAAVLIIFGIFMLFHPDWIVAMLHAMLGLGILVDGIFKIIKALEARAFGLEKWWLVLSFALMTCIFGLLLLFDPFGGVKLLMTFAGIFLIAEGLENVWVALYAFRTK